MRSVIDLKVRFPIRKDVPQHTVGHVRVAGDPPPGCHFHPRCPRAEARCRASYPDETTLAADHVVRCYFPA